MSTPNPKCSSCSCYFVPTSKSSGLPYKTCTKCRNVQKEKLPCECGIMIRCDWMSRHKKSQQHKDIIDEMKRIGKTMNGEEIKQFLYGLEKKEFLSDEMIKANIECGNHNQSAYRWNTYDFVDLP